MALGAITQVAIDPHSQSGGVPVVTGDTKLAVINVVGDGAYSAGGSSIPASAFGLTAVLSADAQITTVMATIMSAIAVVQSDGSVKLKTFSGTGATPTIGLVEATGTANQSALVVQIQAQGY
jgi:hypothetical protein